MRIGIDIDCVCNNLVEEWLKCLNTEHKLNVKYEDVTSYSMNQFFPTLTLNQIYEPLYKNDMWKSLVPVKDSTYYMQQLINDGHDIKLITATNVNSMPVKCEWILKHYPYIKEKDIWMVFDKTWINMDILLDDCIDNLCSENYTGICYAQPWNTHYDGLRVNNWKEFYNLVKEL